MVAPDYSPSVYRRISIMSERMDMLYSALHLSLIVAFVGVLFALYTVRNDILREIRK